MHKIFNFIVIAIVTSFLFIPSAFAANANGITAQDRTNIEQALKKVSKQAGKKINIVSIDATPVSNLLQVTTDVMICYVTKDGKYVLVGDLIDVNKDKSAWSFTETAARKQRLALLAQVDQKDMIIFPATKKKVAAITVFTDIDCQYCRKMHAEIKKYNDLGIEVRYLAFPRGGPNTAGFKKAITVWCSENRQESLTLVKQGKELAENFCEPNSVNAQFELGKKMGINGTPTIILENGTKLPGFVPPDELLEIIKEN